MQSILSSQLVEESELRASLAKSLKIGGDQADQIDLFSLDIDDRQLAEHLVKADVLTTYQADQLLAGRTKLQLGPYIVTDWIGQGGMGQVFKAVHGMMGRECAVKVLPINKSTPDAVANFRREIKTQAQLDHPNLVRAFDAGEDGNVHYMVVEYVPGTDLRRLVRSKGKLSVQQASNIIKQIADGLNHAHEKNLIHRDIKPGNVLVTPGGIAKLSDLGLAGYINDANDPRAGKTVGTADYLSPEQIKTPGDITKTSDIYSMGCTLYYAVTGKVPFPGGTPKSKARRHLDETPWHPRRFNDEVTDEFVDLIGDMMEKSPENRIQNAREVAERLAIWASDEPIYSAENEHARWSSTPTPGVDDQQDTEDPNDATEYGGGDTHGSMTNDSFAGRLKPAPVPPPLTSVYPDTPSVRFQDETSIPIIWVFVISVMCAIAGCLAGFIIGRLSG